MFASWIIVGLLAGWGAGRLLAPTRAGVGGDLAWGVVGSVSVAWVMQVVHTGTTDGSLVGLLGGLAGALALTFGHRAFADRFQRAIVR